MTSLVPVVVAEQVVLEVRAVLTHGLTPGTHGAVSHVVLPHRAGLHTRLLLHVARLARSWSRLLLFFLIRLYSALISILSKINI